MNQCMMLCPRGRFNCEIDGTDSSTFQGFDVPDVMEKEVEKR